MKFTEFDLHDDLLKGIADAGFTRCMPVQEETLAHTLKGRDVTVQSQTGSGKTAAFLITIYQHFLADGPIKQKRALIIAPTRELAVQIEKDAKILGKYLPFSIGAIYGGVGYANQQKMLQEGLDIVIGTPGRLLDLSYKKLLDFKTIGCLVIDEADRLFDMGFLPDIRKMVRKMLPRSHRQTMLFSATLDYTTRDLAYEYMNDPVAIEISPEQVTVENISQELYHVAKKEKINLLLGLLKKNLPRNALIFTNMKHTAVQVAKNLEHNGYKCQHLIGDLPQKKRLKVIDDFKAGRLPLLVASDVASRGLHVEDLELIVNYDLPEDCESYVHRIGRTARAGKSGKAIALACEECVYNLPAIEEFIGMKIPVKHAEDELFEKYKAVSVNHRYKEGFARERDRKSSRRRARGRASRPAEKSREARHPGAVTPGERAPARSDDYRRKAKKKQHAPKRPDTAKPTRSAPPPKPPRTAKAPQVKPKGTMEQRLEYYRKKYGDDFKISPEPAGRPQKAQKTKKISLIKKLPSLFRKGK